LLLRASHDAGFGPSFDYRFNKRLLLTMTHNPFCNLRPVTQPDQGTSRPRRRRLACRSAALAAAAVIASPISPASAVEGLGIIVENKIDMHKHLDFVGKPCLVTLGVARPLTSNSRVMNHIVSFDNHCVARIRLKVCYAGTEDCTDVEVPGYGRKEQVIGVLPAIQLFRYEVRELF
jgi:hypothetical protein